MRLFVQAVIGVFVSISVFGQTTTLLGVVTDESGAIVQGATITLTNSTGMARTAVRGNDGSYAIDALTAGEYTAQASAPDLKTGPIKVVIGPAGQTLNLSLKVTLATQEVTVDEQPATVSVDPRTTPATILKGQDLDALSDNPDDLINDLIAIAGPSAGPGGASVFIDGFTGGQIPSKDSIREIRINQNPFSAEYDKIGTGRIEILTRPGTNQLYGTGQFNYRLCARTILPFEDTGVNLKAWNKSKWQTDMVAQGPEGVDLEARRCSRRWSRRLRETVTATATPQQVHSAHFL
jgi:hypothetical protein